MRTCKHVHTHAHMYITLMCTCKHVYTHAHLYTHSCTQTHAHHTHAYTQTHMYTPTLWKPWLKLKPDACPHPVHTGRGRRGRSPRRHCLTRRTQSVATGFPSYLSTSTKRERSSKGIAPKGEAAWSGGTLSAIPVWGRVTDFSGECDSVPGT